MSQFFNCMILECMHCFLLSFPPISCQQPNLFKLGGGGNAWLGGGANIDSMLPYYVALATYYRIEAIVTFRHPRVL